MCASVIYRKKERGQRGMKVIDCSLAHGNVSTQQGPIVQLWRLIVSAVEQI